ncbi:MAG: MFS transporter [Actinobacteria bacterium]|nr:MFS transporter [Actinomycetota bacterium]
MTDPTGPATAEPAVGEPVVKDPAGTGPVASQPVATEPVAELKPEPKPRSLWSHGDFLKLWGGQSLSLVGTQVTIVAMPLVALQLLDASATQMGVLGGLARAPFVLFLFAGVWADRVRRRPTMIATDLGRGVLIGLIPILYYLGDLRMAWLYLIVLLAGILGVFFEVSNQAFIPSLVEPEFVPEANAKFQISQSSAQVAGPGLAGILIAFLSAASVIVIDAISYFVGAIASMLIRMPEEKPGGTSRPPKLFAAIGAGLKWVWTQPVIRPMMFATAFYMAFTSGIQALYVFYLDRDLHLAAGWIGFTLAFLGVGAVIGSLFSLKTLKRFGPGPTAFWATVVGNAAFLLVPLAGGPIGVTVAILALAQALIGMSGPIAQVSMGSLRMRLTPNDMQGRVVATFRGLSLGLAPVGALLAGVLAQAVGLRLILFIFAIGVLAPIVVMWFSPIPRAKTFPAPVGS